MSCIFNGKQEFGLRVRLVVLLFLCISTGARAQRYEVLHEFSGTDGANPFGSLVQGSDGNFYGTTRYGGANGAGAIYRIDSAGHLTTLHSFSGDDGAAPMGALIEATDGSFYGTATNGGDSCGTPRVPSSCGTAFKTDSSGSFEVVYRFGEGGARGVNPNAGLIQASDGNLYGTAYYGGGTGEQCFLFACGTVLKLDAEGNPTTVHAFVGNDGAYPSARLVQAADGALYGTTAGGGQNSGGTIFKIDTSGAFTTLYSFPVNSLPYAGLIQASDGKFYGTTYGTVFRMDSSGNVTTLHAFTSAEDFGAYSELLQASDGYFYGTLAYSWMMPCPQSGEGNCGSIFRMDASGNVTFLHVFRGPDGAVPRAGLIQAADGSLYGTTSEGGAGNVGVIFRIDLQLTPAGITAATRCDTPGGCRARP